MSDPAAGKFEVPGGHLDQDESPRAAAIREWQEETGLPFPDGEWTGQWTSSSGIYQGFVLTVPREADVDIFARQIGSDPDGDVDGTETIAWWDPADLPGNPAVRAELQADLDAVLAAIGAGADEPAAGAKVSKESVSYRAATEPGQCCGTCSMIRMDGAAGYACTLVEGPVSPDGVCDEWDPAEGTVAKASVVKAPKALGRGRAGTMTCEPPVTGLRSSPPR